MWPLRCSLWTKLKPMNAVTLVLAAITHTGIHGAATQSLAIRGPTIHVPVTQGLIILGLNIPATAIRAHLITTIRGGPMGVTNARAGSVMV